MLILCDDKGGINQKKKMLSVFLFKFILQTPNDKERNKGNIKWLRTTTPGWNDEIE